MATDDWYRNTTWDDKIENDFEARFRRSRGTFNKAQYLRIQGSYLLDSSDLKTQQVGIRQMQRLINDFPTEEFSTVFGHEQLGDYYSKHRDFENAICDKLKKRLEAKDHAKTAIEISKITEPQFYRHKTVGLVATTEQQLRTLEQIESE